MTSEGDANKSNLTKNSEGDNKFAADAILIKSLPNLASMTVRKGVSSVDVQSGITKPSFPPTNEVDHTKMPKLINLSQRGLHCSERIRKYQDTKKAKEYHTKK